LSEESHQIVFFYFISFNYNCSTKYIFPWHTQINKHTAKYFYFLDVTIVENISATYSVVWALVLGYVDFCRIDSEVHVDNSCGSMHQHGTTQGCLFFFIIIFSVTLYLLIY
jgi:hypothetical protein